MTNDEAQKMEQAWREVLLVKDAGEQELFTKLRDLFERAYTAGCERNRPVTLVAVAASTTARISHPSDALILRHDPTVSVSPVGWEIFKNMIGGTRGGLIRLPIHVFLFGDRAHAVQGVIDTNGNWATLPF
jgi:hypothetical protein